MYCAEAQSDVMRSALLTREAHITDEVNITPEGHIMFRVSGTHRSKKPNARALGFFVAGVAGFGPANAGVKVLCLTAWRYPNMKQKYYSTKKCDCQPKTQKKKRQESKF